MSGLRQRLVRLGATAAVLAIGTAAIFAVAGVEVDTASALGAHCSGEAILGEGASLQGMAQATWTVGFNLSANPLACNGTQGTLAKPKVTYLSTGSGAALREWGATTGALGPNGVQDNFIGTTEPPTATQLTNMKKALRAHGIANSTNVVTIPVAQTAIAIVVNLPSGCSLTRITNAQLQAAFAGTAKTWTEIGAVGTGCGVAIKRVVRTDGSGVTYQFKQYLFRLNSASLCVAEFPGGMTWQQLQNEFEVGTAVPNRTWPDCAGSSMLIRPAGSGGTEVVKTVNATDGAIGYVGLPEAEAFKTSETTILEVQDGIVSAKQTFAPPSASESRANCEGIPYSKPRGESGTEVSSWEEAGMKPNLDWSQVYGSNPTIGAGRYSICTLSWVEAATESTKVWGVAKATSIHDYLKFVVAMEGGQAEISKKWFARLPFTTTSNVRIAAERAVEQIG
jgi:ABC-type phosphate transport system substrate-binding protein